MTLGTRTLLVAIVAGCIVVPVARATYVPATAPASTTITVKPLIADGGTDAVTDIDVVYSVASGSTDNVWTLPSATGLTGHWIEYVDTVKAAETAWLAWAPQSGQALSPLPADQRALLARAGDRVRLVSNGADWVCVGGCDALVADPRRIGAVVAKVWLDSERGVGVTGTAPPRMNAWADQSGNGFNFAEVGGAGPILTYLANGLPAAGSNGNTYLKSSALAFTSRTITGLAVVTDISGPSAYRGIFAYDYTDAPSGFFFGDQGSATNGIFFYGRWCGNGGVVSALSYIESQTLTQRLTTAGTPIRMYATSVGVTSYFRTNGTTLEQVGATTGSVAQAAPTDGFMYLMQSHFKNADNDFYLGTVQSVVVYDGGISIAAIVLPEDFLNRRFRLR